jgi:hypothetical protein
MECLPSATAKRTILDYVSKRKLDLTVLALALWLTVVSVALLSLVKVPDMTCETFGAAEPEHLEDQAGRGT